MISLTNIRYATDVQVNSTKNLILPKSMFSVDALISSNAPQSDSLSTQKRATNIDSEQIWPRLSPWLNLGNFPTVLLNA